MNARVLAAAALAAACLAPAGGCLISSNKSTAITGAYVERADLISIDPGTTTLSEVEQRLGPPTARQSLDDGSERWVYRWSKTTQGSGAVFLIFGGASHEQVVEAVAITFRDGVVESIERI